MKSQEPPPKRKFKAAKVTTPSPDVDAAKALADYHLRMGARLTEETISKSRWPLTWPEPRPRGLSSGPKCPWAPF